VPRILHSFPPAANQILPFALTLSNIVAFFDLGASTRSTWGILFASGFVLFGAMHLFISYGSWLSQEYALGAAQLGQVAFILGCGIWYGSVLVSVLNDRFGKRRAFLWGCLLASICFLALPFFKNGLIAALIGLVFIVALVREANSL